MIAANIRYGDLGGLQRIDLGRIVVLPGDVGLVDRLGHAALVQLFFRFTGKSFAVSGAVVKDRDFLVGPMIRQIVAGHDVLRVVAANDAKHIGAALLG